MFGLDIFIVGAQSPGRLWVGSVNQRLSPRGLGFYEPEVLLYRNGKPTVYMRCSENLKP